MKDYIEVDLKNWDRLSVFEFFHRFDDQLFSIDFDLTLPDNFSKSVKEKLLTPFTACLYIMSKVLNDIEEFRFRLLNNKVVLYSKINPVWVEIDKNKNLVPVTCDFETELSSFIQSLKNRRPITSLFLKDVPNHFTVSNNHWLDWTSIKHTRCTHNETNQKLVWGKIEGNSVRFSMEVSHLFVDGYHISLFKKQVEAGLKELVNQ